MQNLFQRTLAHSVSCAGIGLHSGQKIKLTLHPAPADTGFVFFRTDLAEAPAVEARLENVVHTRLATTLGHNGVTIGTVEHLLATLAGLGFDNARIEVCGPEVPIMDGSSAPFVYLLRSAGVKVLSKYKKFIVIHRPIIIQDGDKSIAVYPSRELSVDYEISFEHPVVKSQKLDFHFSDLAFANEISRARTFGFLHEVEYLKKNGFAKGGSFTNAIVIASDRILNQDGLRYPNELVRHKILDFIGDISLIGAPIIGAFKVFRSGHTLNNLLLKKLMATPQAWSLEEFSHPALCRANNVTVPSWGLLEAPSRQAA